MLEMTSLYYRLSLFLLIIGLGLPKAQADDIYNFHFEKKENPKFEVSEDVLLIPDNWEPSKGKTRVYVRKQKVAAQQSLGSLTATAPDIRLPKPKSWEIKGGFGYMFFPGMAQNAYALSGRYFFNRYFAINSELMLPNGEAVGDGGYSYYAPVADEEGNTVGYSYFEKEDKIGPQVGGSIGVGAIPIHMTFLGREFLEVGFDAGVLFGRRPSNGYNTSGGSSSIYLGTRFDFKFTPSWILSVAAKFDTNYSGFGHSSFAVGYRW